MICILHDQLCANADVYLINGMYVSDSWDCVATCFFIDTAHNVIQYVETIWKILKPGGVWINLGESSSQSPSVNNIKRLVSALHTVTFVCMHSFIPFYSLFRPKTATCQYFRCLLLLIRKTRILCLFCVD